MRRLLALAAALFARERRSFFLGLALSVAVLGAGIGLLGLAGWFIVVAAAAGLAGTGAVFNVFGPSAMVRFLALGRTAARYGERLSTHDATLRALSWLRIRLLEGLLHAPWRGLERMRASTFLNRVTADIDALDGIALRLILPGLSGGAAIVGAAALLWVLVHPALAIWVGGGTLLGANLVYLLGQKLAQHPARRAEAAMQALRSRLIDLVVAREDLAVYGQLARQQDHVRAAADRHMRARARLDRIERRTGFALDMVGGCVAAGALALGGGLAQTGTITPGQAAIGVFTALALGEAVAPIRRALTEIGRMSQAARRVAPALEPVPAVPGSDLPGAGPLRLDGVTYRCGLAARALFAPVSLEVAPGETVALTGASGSGKSTVLLMAAGALAPSAGRVMFGGTDIAGIAPERIAERIAMVPQRHALMAGSVAENLRLAAPGASDAELMAVLEATQLAATLEAKGGLTFRLGFRGTGLSGGEARRLVLARALLTRPAVLLLDEPTEGLDTDTAAAVMRGIRRSLPDAAILLAAHRASEIAAADRALPLQPAAV